MADDLSGDDARALVGLLADDDRRRVFAALVLGATTAADVAAAAVLDAKRTGKALARLVSGGAVTLVDGRYEVVVARFGDVAREGAVAAKGPVDAGDEAKKLLRNYVKGGRLLTIPTARAKRLVVLDWLASRFEPGTVYAERDVNTELLAVHDDSAALRRYLVDEGFFERRDGFYWRAGGTFDPDE